MTPAPLALIDAVMGELFAEDEPRAPGRVAGLAKPQFGLAPGGSFRLHRPEAYLGALAGRPEAMVKIIPRGGCHDRAALGRQIAYLSQGSEVAIHGAAAYGLDVPQTETELAAIMADWAKGWRGNRKHRHSMHMVVSFPPGTDPQDAFDAARDFAETAFGLGTYGDAWGYVVAAHMDRSHPHVHIVLNRHGLDHGRLLSTWKTAPLNPDELRRLLVEAAAPHGIELTATARFARGLTDRSPGTVAIRRDREAAAAEAADPSPDPQAASQSDPAPEQAPDPERAPPPDQPRSGPALAYADAAIAAHAGAWARLAEAFGGLNRPELAEALALTAALMTEGAEIIARPEAVKPEDFTTLETARQRIAKALDGAEAKTRALTDPGMRAEKERAPGLLKGRAAAFLPERAELAPHAAPPAVRLWRAEGLAALERVRQIWEPVLSADTQNSARSQSLSGDPGAAGQALEDAPLTEPQAKALTEARAAVTAALPPGLDPATFHARLNAGGPADAGTAAQWIAGDLVAVLKARGITPDRTSRTEQTSAAEALDRLHGLAETTLGAVAARIIAELAITDRSPPPPGTPARNPAAGPVRPDARAVKPLPENEPAPPPAGTAPASLDTLHTAARDALARPEAPEARAALTRFTTTLETLLPAEARTRLRDGDPSALATLAPDRLTRARLATTWAAATQALAPTPTRAVAEALTRATRELRIAEGLVGQAAERARGSEREADDPER